MLIARQPNKNSNQAFIPAERKQVPLSFRSGKIEPQNLQTVSLGL
jgi:hypothetical protein